MRQQKILIILVILLGITTLIFAGLFLSSRGSIKNETFAKKYPLIDIARNSIPQEDYVVNLQPLRERLAPIYEKYGTEKISLYVEFLNTGANISYNGDARYYPASLIKMPVAMAAMKKIEKDEWSSDSELILFEQDINDRYGELYNQPIGSHFTIQKLLEEMLVNSDNTAHKMLLRNVGAGDINAYIAETGLEDLFDSERNITAKEYTRIFRTLYGSSYLEPENSQEILELLSQGKDDILLDRGLPDDVIFSHKFGVNSDEAVHADSGIVYIPNRPYIITVLFKGDGTESDETVNAIFEEISRAAYEHFSQ